MIGVDSSPDMLAKAREVAPGVTFSHANARDWQPDRPLDVIFCNAVLHWLPDHDKLFPRLMSLLAKDGVLAVQMPRNHESPSHQLMLQAAAQRALERSAGSVQGINPVHDPAFYFRALASRASDIDIWEAEYLHVLHRRGPSRGMDQGNGVAALPGCARRRASRRIPSRRIGSLVAEAYPPEPDGRTLFPFRRIFIVARRN